MCGSNNDEAGALCRKGNSMLLTKAHYLSLKDGVFDATTKADLDNLFITLATPPINNNLVVHFHGGLVDSASAMHTAENLMNFYQGLDAYQVFFIWESGLLDVLAQKLNVIFADPTYQQLVLSMTQFAATFPGNKRAQTAQKAQFAKMLEDSYILPPTSAAVLGPNIEQATGVLDNVMNRFAQGRDHGLYATVVEELLRAFYIYKVGTDIWDQMKQETLDAFGTDPNQYGGTAFLQGLANYWKNGQHPRITLVGHSAGANYICRFLQFADLYQLPEDMQFDVVFLAPACTFDLFSQTLKYKQRIKGIRIFGMNDTLEQANSLVAQTPLIYPYSLLYFVSGVLEDEADTPLLGMQRYYSGKAPYKGMPEVDDSLTYLQAAGPDPNVWSIATGANGLASSSMTHGSFYSDISTLDSLKYIILNGL
jgi:hypothetical protein